MELRSIMPVLSRESHQVVALPLMALLAVPAWAQEVSPALLPAARESYRQQFGEQSLFSGPRQAQANPQVPPASETDWNNLARLAVGARIAVKIRDEPTHSGKFLGFSEESISLREGKREIAYHREDVLRVWLLGGRNRGKAAKLGFLFPFAATVGVTFASLPSCEDDCFLLFIGGLGIGAVFGGVGAAVGALVAPRSKTVIYRAAP